MIRTAARVIRAEGLLPRQLVTVHVQQKAFVCNVCAALSRLHRQQQQQLHGGQQHEKKVLTTHTKQLPAEHRLLSSPYRGQLVSPRLEQSTVNLDNFDINKHWAYGGEFGMESWSTYFKSSLGSSQSPVDFPADLDQGNAVIDKLKFTNFDNVSDVTWLLENNGRSAQVTYLSGDVRLSGANLTSDYNVLQFHFHWGSDDTKGSEHTVGGVRYPMEMHIVTYRNEYEDFNSALRYSDGLAILGVFFELNAGENSDMRGLISALDSIKTPDSQCSVAPVPLERFIPRDSSQFYRYHGSMSTPPCSEAVIWTVFRMPLGISSSQLAAFRQLQSLERDSTGANKRLVDNFRPTQQLNGRHIIFSSSKPPTFP